MKIELPPPRGPKGEKRESDRKVVDIVRARQERRGSSRVYFKAGDYPVDRERWRGLLCEDGRVYFDVLVGGACIVQLDLSPSDIRLLGRDLIRLETAQRRYHERLRGAHLWIARAHPTVPGWLMVKHMDHETPFRPVTVGARKKSTAAMPTCCGCGKSFGAGEHAFEAKWMPAGYFGNGSRPRICKGCTQPPRKDLVELEGGKS